HIHAAYPARVTAHWPDLALTEARCLARARDHDDVVVAARLADSDQLVVVPDIDGDDPVGLDRGVVGQEIRLLHHSLPGGKHQVLTLGEVPSREHRLDPLSLAQGEHIYERAAARSA